MEQYYKVTAKCGHVGRGHYIEISFAVRAESGKQAAALARKFPRVKHDHPDAIRDVQLISRAEYLALLSENDADPYLHCSNVQQQRQIQGLEYRLIPENDRHAVHTRDSSVNYKRRRRNVDDQERRREMRGNLYTDLISA